VIAFQKDLDVSPEWLQITGWTLKPGARQSRNRNLSLYVQPRSGLLAESVVAYRFNALRFKKENPGRYAFIKDKVFGGREFLRFENCNPEYNDYAQSLKVRENEHARIRSEDRKNREVVADAMTSYLAGKPAVLTLTPAQNQAILRKCLNIYLSDIANGQTKNSNSCVDKEMKTISFNEHLRKKGLNIDPESLTDEMLAPISLSAKERGQFYSYIAPILSESFNEAYENTETYLGHASSEKQCELFAQYYKEDLPVSLAPYIAKGQGGGLNADVEKIVVRACKIGIKDFGNLFIPRKYNIFGSNPFSEIFK